MPSTGVECTHHSALGTKDMFSWSHYNLRTRKGLLLPGVEYNIRLLDCRKDSNSPTLSCYQALAKEIEQVPLKPRVIGDFPVKEQVM